MLVNIPLLFLSTKHQLVLLFFSAETMHSNSAAVTRLSTTTGALFTQFYFLFTKHLKRTKRQGIYPYPLSYLSVDIQILKPFMW